MGSIAVGVNGIFPHTQYMVAVQLFEAVRYKLEGHGFDC